MEKAGAVEEDVKYRPDGGVWCAAVTPNRDYRNHHDKDHYHNLNHHHNRKADRQLNREAIR